MEQEAHDARRRGTSQSQAQPGEAASAHTRTEESPPSVATAAVPAAGERLKAFVGFRAWKVRNGQLYSPQAPNIVWPVNQAIEAENKARWTEWTHLVVTAVVVVSGLFAGQILGEIIRDKFGLLWGVPLIPAYLIANGVLLWRGFQLVRQYFGPQVQTGANTPGVYAMYMDGMINPFLLAHKSGTVTVKGSVFLWGETIEHEYGR